MSTATVEFVAVDDREAKDARRASRKAKEWTARRDELIRQMHASGASLREIARVVELSNPGVLRIIRRGHPPSEQGVLGSAEEVAEALREYRKYPIEDPGLDLS